MILSCPDCLPQLIFVCLRCIENTGKGTQKDTAFSLWSEHCSPSPFKTEGAQGGRREKQRSVLVHKNELQSCVLGRRACSCSGGTGLQAHERVHALPAVLAGGRLVLRCDHDGVLIHQLTGGVGEGRQRQGDPLHLALVHSLLMLLL